MTVKGNKGGKKIIRGGGSSGGIQHITPNVDNRDKWKITQTSSMGSLVGV